MTWNHSQFCWIGIVTESADGLVQWTKVINAADQSWDMKGYWRGNSDSQNICALWQQFLLKQWTDVHLAWHCHAPSNHKRPADMMNIYYTRVETHLDLDGGGLECKSNTKQKDCLKKKVVTVLWNVKVFAHLISPGGQTDLTPRSIMQKWPSHKAVTPHWFHLLCIPVTAERNWMSRQLQPYQKPYSTGILYTHTAFHLHADHSDNWGEKRFERNPCDKLNVSVVTSSLDQCLPLCPAGTTRPTTSKRHNNLCNTIPQTVVFKEDVRLKNSRSCHSYVVPSSGTNVIAHGVHSVGFSICVSSSFLFFHIVVVVSSSFLIETFLLTEHLFGDTATWSHVTLFSSWRHSKDTRGSCWHSAAESLMTACFQSSSRLLRHSVCFRQTSGNSQNLLAD